MKLRPYQEKMIDDIRNAIRRGKKRLVCVLGCGGGKSVIQATISKGATDKHNDVVFIVHRKELCQQIEGTFSKCGVDFNHCSINMVQTLTRRIDKMNAPKLLITDEAHHSLSKSYRNILDTFPNAVKLFFTATPIRLDGAGLGEVADEIIQGVSTSWLIENGYLAPYKYYGVALADTSKLHTRNGDFDKQEVEQLMNNKAVFGNAVENWKKFADGKKTIIYCSSIETSKATTEAFQKAGISAAHLDGNTPKAERERVIEEFRSGKILLLANVDLFGEGFDVPDCECVVLLRPTKSLSLHIQQSMRSMRSDGLGEDGRNKSKVAIILDHVSNYRLHGLPDDERTWSLAGRKKKERNTVIVRECPVCFAVAPATATVCPICGAALKEEKKKAERKVIDMMLQEISQRPYNDYKKCKTFEEMDLFRKAKKHHFLWTLHKCLELNIPIPKKYNGMVNHLRLKK